MLFLEDTSGTDAPMCRLERRERCPSRLSASDIRRLTEGEDLRRRDIDRDVTADAVIPGDLVADRERRASSVFGE